MKIQIRLPQGAYIINGTVTNLITRVRKTEIKDNYDLVEVECDNWKEIRLVYFNGVIAIPEEFEDGEITLWDIQEIKNSYNDVSIDIAKAKIALKKIYDDTATFDIQKIISDLQKDFNIKVNEALTK